MLLAAISMTVSGAAGGGTGWQAAGPPVAFEVATVKRVDPGPKSGRYIKMVAVHRFVAKNFTLKLLIAAAYDLNPKTILGGPGWIDSEQFEINAVTPGDAAPARDEQMKMLRELLVERFKLKFHREQKDFSIYVLSVAPGGAKLKTSTAGADVQPAVVSTVYPDRIRMPARNASMGDFTAVMQRAILDRPVVNRTGLAGRYDFDLEWAPDETQFGGEMPAPMETQSPPLFVAMRQELGLTLEGTRGPVSAMVVDGAERPGVD